MSPEMRTLSKSALSVFGGIAATTLLKRGMKSALATAHGGDGPSSTLGLFTSLLKGEPIEESSHVEHFARFAYSAGWLAMVAVAGSKLAVKNAPLALAGGAVLGVAVWAAGEIGKQHSKNALPRTKATAVKDTVLSLAEHVLYGTAALAPVAARSYLRDEGVAA